MNKISGITLIEMLIGIVISSIIIAAMYTSYSIINNTYSRVTDVAGISKSGRDIVSMVMRDVRMAGYKFYYGYNTENEQKDASERIPRLDYLDFIAGDTAATEKNSHAPVVIYRNTLGDKTRVSPGDPIAPGYTLLDSATKLNNVCCDQIHIVFGDFDANADLTAGEQYYKKYKISYFARALEKDGDKFYGVFRSKKYWKQSLGESNGKWVTNASDCPGDECYEGELVREYLTDMSFIALDRFGQVVDADPKNPDKIYDIRSIDITLTFRSATKSGFFKNSKDGITREVLSLGREPAIFSADQAAYKRDSIFVTVHTRNLGGLSIQ